MPRKGLWKQIRLDGQLYGLLKQKAAQRGWRYDMTKFVEDVLWDYSYGRLIPSESTQAGGGRIAIGAEGGPTPASPGLGVEGDTQQNKGVHKRSHQKK